MTRRRVLAWSALALGTALLTALAVRGWRAALLDRLWPQPRYDGRPVSAWVRDLAANPEERSKLRPEVSLVAPEMVARLESRIDTIVDRHPLPEEFVVPGANPVSAALDVARASARRAERRTVALRASGAEVNEEVLRYLNRLSDLLFVLARREAGESPEPRSRDR